MNLEALLAFGVTQEQAESILSLHKTAIDGNYVPKATFTAEREKVATFKQQVEDRDQQIADLGKFEGTAKQLQEKVDALEKSNKEAAERHEAEIKQITEEAILRFELAPLVHDADDVLSKLDSKVITFEDGKVKSGLTEQLEHLKQSKPHYFKQEVAEKKGLPEGWSPFGVTPPEGKDEGDKGDKAAAFGTELAKARSASETAAAKAAETYFQ